MIRDRDPSPIMRGLAARVDDIGGATARASFDHAASGNMLGIGIEPPHRAFDMGSIK